MPTRKPQNNQTLIMSAGPSPPSPTTAARSGKQKPRAIHVVYGDRIEYHQHMFDPLSGFALIRARSAGWLTLIGKRDDVYASGTREATVP
jgi:hypothetical protein